MNYIKDISPAGLGKTDRKRLSSILRETAGTITVDEAANILGVSSSSAAKMLARWAGGGWLSRVRRGLYIPVPLESLTTDITPEDPWLLADRIFAPCYLGGWSAAEYWGMTEQIFRTVLVMTARKPRKRQPEFQGVRFLARTVKETSFFGLKTVWRGKARIRVSDPSRTIVDMLSDPALGGGIRSTVDMLSNYMVSKDRDLDLVIDYADRLDNGAVYKRLGFLLERSYPKEEKAINNLKSRLSKGNAELDPRLKSERLVARWRLFVPQSWLKEKQIDR